MLADGGRVLIVEDDLTIAENLYGYLERQGFVPDAAFDGRGALSLLAAGRFDALVLDLGLPGLGGMDVLRAMRREERLWCPVLVLTARDRVEDKLLAFELGAEDYLVKPFALAEVAARLNVLVRRGRRQDPGGAIERAGLRYDPGTCSVTFRGGPLLLSRKSLLLVELLLRADAGVVSQASVRAALWPEGPPSDRALNDQIHLLRRSLREAGGPEIVSIRGMGWQLQPQDDGGASVAGFPAMPSGS